MKQKGREKKIPAGAYQSIVSKHTAEHDIIIKKSTIYSRIKSKCLTKNNMTPMAEVEPKLVKILTALGHSRYPQSVSTVIHLANEITSGTDTETVLDD